MKKEVIIMIDVVGACNLRCPSCPVGAWGGDEPAYATGRISEVFLEEILQKALDEVSVRSVGLFNWSEPLLHPNLPELIRLVRSLNLPCAVSSNLNLLRDPEELLATRLNWLRVSVSGFTQETYRRAHVRGDIEKVKANMRRLAEAKDRLSSNVTLQLYYHKYIDNESEESLMRKFAHSLGFDFETGWAYLLAVEKLLALAAPDDPSAAPLLSEDHAVLDRLALKMPAALEITREQPVDSCLFLEDFLTIDARGDVYLCCAATGRPSNRIGNFLEHSFDELQRRKRCHPVCGPCMKNGLPVLFEGKDPAFDRAAESERHRYDAGGVDP